MADKTARQAADRRGQGEKWLVIDKTKNLISPFNAPSFALFVPFCGYFRTPPSLSVFAALREIFFSFIRVHSRSLFAAIRGYFLRSFAAIPLSGKENYFVNLNPIWHNPGQRI
jgi:hypothetical protein